MGSNRKAAEVVVAKLRADNLLEARDEALVAGFLALAAAVDDNPGSPVLWREYRGFIDAVRKVGCDVADDDTAQFLELVRTPVGNAKVSGEGDVRKANHPSRRAVGDAVDAVAGAGGVGRRRARS